MSERHKWLMDAGLVLVALVLMVVALLGATAGHRSSYQVGYESGYESALNQCPQEDSCDYIDGRWVPVEH